MRVIIRRELVMLRNLVTFSCLHFLSVVETRTLEHLFIIKVTNLEINE